MEVLLSAGKKLAEEAKIQTDGGTVSMTTSIPLTEVPIGSIASALIRARVAAERLQTPHICQINGEEAMFQPSKETLVSDVQDGLGRTIMIVAPNSAVPWTTPIDLVYAKDKPLPVRGGFFD